jgi:hypothetical protein
MVQSSDNHRPYPLSRACLSHIIGDKRYLLSEALSNKIKTHSKQKGPDAKRTEAILVAVLIGEIPARLGGYAVSLFIYSLYFDLVALKLIVPL